MNSYRILKTIALKISTVRLYKHMLINAMHILNGHIYRGVFKTQFEHLRWGPLRI